MQTIHDLAPLRERVAVAKRSGHAVGFVPTMGALHEGHLSLVRQARRESGFVVVSIFVNPLQFGPSEDFARYPRRPEEDAKLLDSAGADLLYAPDPAAFFPADFSTAVEVAGVTDGGEGAMRPGHFRGVATVVAKLFLQVAPDAAYFGRKDLQQTAVIRRMVRDLDFPIRLVIGDTVREDDGLAMSSRNAYLSPADRATAASLSRALFAARDQAQRGGVDAAALEAEVRRTLEEAGLAVDYVETVDPVTMRRDAKASAGAALAAAVRIGRTRLLDNVLLSTESEPERNRP
ncbi:MAG: pantoate--beta-alanine ligase [Acidobacteriota bacterium]